MTGIFHIVLARKPLEGTIAENCLQWGCGALWIDGCRVDANGERTGGNGYWGLAEGKGWNKNSVPYKSESRERIDQGRFPANLILDSSASTQMGEQSGTSKSSGGRTIKRSGGTYVGGTGDNVKTWSNDDPGFGDTGTAARFFFNFSEQESDE
jgi:hypothetical protein